LEETWYQSSGEKLSIHFFINTQVDLTLKYLQKQTHFVKSREKVGIKQMSTTEVKRSLGSKLSELRAQYRREKEKKRKHQGRDKFHFFFFTFFLFVPSLDFNNF